MTNQVQFYSGDSEKFKILETKDNNVLYFLEDTQEIYKGSNKMSSGSDEVYIGNEEPSNKNVKIWINPEDTDTEQGLTKDDVKTVITEVTDTVLNGSSNNPISNSAVEKCLRTNLDCSPTLVNLDASYVAPTEKGQGNLYVVRNGICYATLDFSPLASLNGATIATELPKPEINFSIEVTPFNTTGFVGSGVLIITNEFSSLVAVGCYPENRYMVSFSYPIKEEE